jgi:hypothetical protein
MELSVWRPAGWVRLLAVGGGDVTAIELALDSLLHEDLHSSPSLYHRRLPVLGTGEPSEQGDRAVAASGFRLVW